MSTGSCPLALQSRHSADWGRRAHWASSTMSPRAAVGASRGVRAYRPGGGCYLSSAITPGPFLHHRRLQPYGRGDRRPRLEDRGRDRQCKRVQLCRAQGAHLPGGTTHWTRCPQARASSPCLKTGGRCHRTPLPGHAGASGATTTPRRATGACRMQISVLRTPVPGGGQPTQIRVCAEDGSQKKRMVGAPPAMNGRLKRGWVAGDPDSD